MHLHRGGLTPDSRAAAGPASPSRSGPHVDPPPPATIAKPLLRGVSHQWGALVFAIAGIALVADAPARARPTLAVYATCITLMLATSALYHRGRWTDHGTAVMRKADHSGIFLAIAGTYTPLSWLALDHWTRWAVLLPVWILAIAGIALEWLPFTPPQGYVTAVYVTLGWIAVIALPSIWSDLGTTGFGLIVGAGLLYTVGAFVHAFHWPDPWPTVFGYHEIWHVFVLVAAGMHFACIAFIVV